MFLAIKRKHKQQYKVARAQGYQYVFDSSTGVALLAEGRKDLLVDVKKN
jgi:hypothetical protein